MKSPFIPTTHLPPRKIRPANRRCRPGNEPADGQAAMLVRAARETVHAIEPGPAVYSAQPLTDVLSAILSQQQFRTLLVGAFSALALTLATSGLYGVMTCSVSLRTRQSVFGWLWELHGHQLGELRGDVCHRIFCSTEAGSRAEQGADFPESFVRRLVHNGDWSCARTARSLVWQLRTSSSTARPSQMTQTIELTTATNNSPCK